MNLPSAAKKFLTGVSALALALAGTVLISTPAAAAPLTANDEATLVAAITTANLDAAPDVITLGADITLTANLPDITESLEIIGDGHIITGAGHRVFRDDWIATTNIDLTFTRIGINSAEPAINTKRSNVTIIGSTFDDAQVTIFGAGITVIVSDSSFDNSDDTSGLYSKVSDSASISITGATATDNWGEGFELFIEDGSTATLDHITATGNGTSDTWDGLYAGVDSDSKLTITNSTATGNGRDGFGLSADIGSDIAIADSTATDNGGDGFGLSADIGSDIAIADSTASRNGGEGAGLLALNGSTVSLERVTVEGNLDGGIMIDDSNEEDPPNDDRTTYTIIDSTIAGNTESGISAYVSLADISLQGSTISGNTADIGGGIAASLRGDSTLTLTNSTISGNTASTVGGVYIDGDSDTTQVTIAHSTITKNVSTEDGAGGVDIYASNYTIDHTVIAGNTSAGSDAVAGQRDLFTTGDATGVVDHSLIQVPVGDVIAVVTAGTGNTSGVDAQLGALADNGGLTLTHLPLEGSPLIDAGDTALSGSPSTDQRGLNRFVDTIDIGAVEVQPEATPPGDTTPGDTTPGDTTPGDTTPGDNTPAAPGGDEVLAATGSNAALPLLGGAALLFALGAAFIIARRRLASN